MTITPPTAERIPYVCELKLLHPFYDCEISLRGCDGNDSDDLLEAPEVNTHVQQARAMAGTYSSSV